MGIIKCPSNKRECYHPFHLKTEEKKVRLRHFITIISNYKHEGQSSMQKLWI